MIENIQIHLFDSKQENSRNTNRYGYIVPMNDILVSWWKVDFVSQINKMNERTTEKRNRQNEEKLNGKHKV